MISAREKSTTTTTLSIVIAFSLFLPLPLRVSLYCASVFAYYYPLLHKRIFQNVRCVTKRMLDLYLCPIILKETALRSLQFVPLSSELFKYFPRILQTCYFRHFVCYIWHAECRVPLDCTDFKNPVVRTQRCCLISTLNLRDKSASSRNSAPGNNALAPAVWFILRR